MLHCDDAGINVTVNEAILRLIRKGNVASISVLSNAPAFDSFCTGFLALPTHIRQHVAIFLHCNIVEFAPLSDQASLKSILTKGKFVGKTKVIRACLLRQLPAEAIHIELQHQLKRATTNGLVVIGLDSHQHMHALSPISEVVAEISRDNHIPLIRSYSQMRCQTRLGCIKLRIFQCIAYATDAAHPPSSWRTEAWQPFVVASWEPIDQSRIAPDTLLVCHPGAPWDKPVTPAYEP